MATAKQRTFIIDCHICKAKVAATETGRAERHTFDDEAGQPYGKRVYVGNCPSCSTILVGESDQIDFENFDAYEDRWSDIVRVYPHPPKLFSSWRIPRVVTDSLNEADRSLQAGANIAACVMLGRALEALCRDILESKAAGSNALPEKSEKKLMLGDGIKKLRDARIIDDRLYDWSQQLQAFRNLAAHPEDIIISREDAGDLQTFVNAIIEYVYDLTDRYDEFKTRAENRAKRKKS
ncbi:DUF4145 domain-containing protein [Ralstonia solanacearum]|uniref:DUF4145 domain-containing protein n=1 Tax=Ralstonia solanacearum TaxID=305 RepID=UPI0009C17E64|nr:DUF4145 domain-containing protein [Ralstonia solanacearum]